MHKPSYTTLVALLALALASPAGAPAPSIHTAGTTTITVTSLADVVANDSVCTLPEAVTSANNGTASGAASGGWHLNDDRVCPSPERADYRADHSP